MFVRMVKTFFSMWGCLLFFTLEISLAEDACSGKPDSVVRLDSLHGSLENAKILDQDSVGVCYATAMATTLQSALPNHPDISYLDYAIQYKKAELVNPNPKLNASSGSVLEGGGDLCKMFDTLKRTGLCPRSKVHLEMAAMSNPGLQVTALSGIGSFFDSQKNKTEAQRKEVMAAVQKSLELARISAEKECKNFPTEMRKVLSDLYFNLKQKQSALAETLNRYAGERAVVQERLNSSLKHQSDLKSKWDDYQHQRDSNKADFDAKVKKKNPKEGSSWLVDKKLKWQEGDLELSFKQNDIQMEMINLSSEINAQQSRVRYFTDQENQIDSWQKQMVLLGEEVPDPDAKLAGATLLKLSSELESRLKPD